MKLIDLLVQELPKRGGWPDGVNVIEQSFHGNLFNGSKPYRPFFFDDERFEIVDEWREARVTREQYEAALAAAQMPVWNGEGLPPVGCRIEAFSGGEWVEAIVTYNEPPECHGDAAAWKEVLAFDCKTTRPFWTDEFRPIRSEADKNRDDAIAKITVAICGEIADTGWATAEKYAARAYDAIAAGKIPHIRIE
ncbi:hypothetical protein QBD22_003864 [Cronobacter muytjensii]|nr:hypothetical protein [Cronobacter muytjensii]